MGDTRINYQIKNQLELIVSKDNVNFISINLNTKKNKSVKEKNIKNEIVKYQIEIKTNLDLFEYASILEKNGAGEILLNSIDNDGMMNGYDLVTINKISNSINIPLIACGGAGTFKDIEDLFLKTTASAAACASLFNFGDNNPFRLRSYLKNAGIKVRKIK